MPDDTIMDMVNNLEPMYNRVMELYDGWMQAGEDLDEDEAQQAAFNLADELAEALSEGEHVRGRYSNSDVRDAAQEIWDGFPEHREYEIKAAAERSAARAARRARRAVDELSALGQEMEAGDIEHAKKNEALAQDIGLERLKSLIPVSPQQVRLALESGDQHLNSIKLRKWDAAALGLRGLELSLSEKVSLLKHVAKWHYA